MAGPNATRKHICLHPGCSRAFPKAEHLARHQRSHSGSKPFSCGVCHRRFGRNDSMLRHSKLHESTGTTTLATPVGTGSGARLQNDTQLAVSPHAPNEASTALDQSVVSQRGSISQQYPREDVPATTLREGDNRVNDPSVMNDSNGSGNGPVPRDFGDMAVLADTFNLDADFDWALSSEDLFNLLRTDSVLMPLTLPITQYSPDTHTSMTYDSLPDPSTGRPNASGSVDVSRQAVRSMSKMIKEVPSKLVAELEAGDIGSSFFDDCLDLFFTHLSPAFPILHKPTFVPRESGSTLLLNILALGSCFIGSKNALARGESLWSLAHAVVATSWQSLMSQRGPRDDCDGVQLVLTAALGQTYALLSKNNNFRMTSQIFHGLGFYWSRQCGMYDAEGFSYGDRPSLGDSPNRKYELWRAWAASETRLRAILGHYVLDGLIAHFSGNATCVRHAANPLPLPARTATFNATSPDAWIVELHKEVNHGLTVRDFISALFHDDQSIISHQISDFGIRVAIECLQSLVLEEIEARGNAIGAPSRSEISSALLRLHRWQICRSAEISELTLRWHAVFLSMAMDTATCCRQISDHFKMQQQLFSSSSGPSRPGNRELSHRLNSVDARRALLHAFAIRDLAQGLPFNRSHAIHLPFSIFAAATAQAAHMLYNTQSVPVPELVDWDTVWCTAPTTNPATLPNQSAQSRIETEAFLSKTYSPQNPRILTRKMSSELHVLRMQMKAMASNWGVAHQMEKILEQWHDFLQEER